MFEMFPPIDISSYLKEGEFSILFVQRNSSFVAIIVVNHKWAILGT